MEKKFKIRVKIQDRLFSTKNKIYNIETPNIEFYYSDNSQMTFESVREKMIKKYGQPTIEGLEQTSVGYFNRVRWEKGVTIIEMSESVEYPNRIYLHYSDEPF